MNVDAAVEPEVDVASASQSSGKRWWLVLLLLALLGGTGGAGAWFMGVFTPAGAEGDGQAGRAAQPRPPLYFTLDSNLVVNFRNPGRTRYLQVGIELMTRDPRAIEALQTHAPVMRNNLIMLLSDQTAEELSGREGKEALQQAALNEVQSVMVRLHGSPAVESLYFTTFVMQ